MRVSSHDRDLGLWRVVIGELLEGTYSALVNPRYFILHEEDFATSDVAALTREIVNMATGPLRIWRDETGRPTTLWSETATKVRKADQDRNVRIMLNAFFGEKCQ